MNSTPSTELLSTQSAETILVHFYLDFHISVRSEKNPFRQICLRLEKYDQSAAAAAAAELSTNRAAVWRTGDNYSGATWRIKQRRPAPRRR